MHTLNYISRGLKTVPAVTSWYLADISEAKGKQDLYTLQSPQKLKVLRECALVESAISSNRLEGVELDKLSRGIIWDAGKYKDKASLPILSVLVFNFDFLCIHPFRDGNGRVSRLLLLLQLYHAGFQVGRYIFYSSEQ